MSFKALIKVFNLWLAEYILMVFEYCFIVLKLCVGWLFWEEFVCVSKEMFS